MLDAIKTDKIITFSFCDSFKNKIVDYIKTTYIDQGIDLNKIAIVFGGKRPAMFIKRDLADIFKTSYYPPHFFTIDEFMQYTVSKSTAFAQTQDLDNCFQLYQLAKKTTPRILEGRETFAQFLPWIREILKFIDQLDLENIQDKALKNIQANAEIGYAVPDDINQLLQNIVLLRQAYHKEHLDQQTYSRGLQYLKAAQTVDDHEFEEFDQVLFCNFFYFHRTEEKVVKSLFEREKATLIFQGDERRWPVLKRIAQMFAVPIREGDQPEETSFNLQCHAGFDVHSQVGMVREILTQDKTFHKSVIVLPDSDHIIPLLSEIGTSITDYNISMGYPLKRSSLYTLFDLMFKAQLSAKEGKYYTKDYLKALRHPFIKNLKLSSRAAVTRILVHKIEEILTGKERASISGSLFIHLDDLIAADDIYTLSMSMLKRLGIKTSKDELISILKEIHSLLFTQWESINRFHDFSVALGRFLDKLVDKSFLKNYPLNLNIAVKILAIKEEFQQAAFANELFDKEELFRIFEHKMAHEKISFSGSPLKGLQILGLLETRALNFDNVIVMDVNEGVLPSLRIHEPLIPREVMISLGLDRLELEEEIQRYQFMRLISSARNVHLVYQESKDKERSRFIEELMWVKQKKKGTLADEPITRPSFQVNVEPKVRSVQKTPEVITFLKNYTYSASSINMYLRNPMDFYLNYVLGLREQEDLLDEPEARHVGTFLHQLLEEGFKPFLNKQPKIDCAFRDGFLDLFEQRFEERFTKMMQSDSFLLRDVILERLNRFLDHEQNNPQRQIEQILYLEHRFEDVISLPVGNIRFRYVVDRIDELKDGSVMILDYKTGGADLMPRPADQIAKMPLSRDMIYDQIKSFQIPLYFYYLDRTFPDQPINAALYNLRTMNILKFIDSKNSLSRKKINEAYLSALNFVLEEILDPNCPFNDEPKESK